jgi:hypothetical protein
MVKIDQIKKLTTSPTRDTITGAKHTEYIGPQQQIAMPKDSLDVYRLIIAQSTYSHTILRPDKY